VAKGGGGTDFRPFFEASAGGEPSRFGHERLAVYLTDGHGVFPKRPPRRPVLWVVTPGGVVDAKFPFGEVVRMRTGGRP
jgi:predicted metal-dependent peptidase